ncbi:MAG TPA: hypothetical protein VIW29_06340, partial [Polyangiaceae bacterium]
ALQPSRVLDRDQDSAAAQASAAGRVAPARSAQTVRTSAKPTSAKPAARQPARPPTSTTKRPRSDDDLDPGF